MTFLANAAGWVKRWSWLFAMALLGVAMLLAMLLRIKGMQLAAAKAAAALERGIRKSEVTRDARVAIAKEQDAVERIAINARYQKALEKIDAEAKKTEAAVAGDDIESRVNERFGL